MTGFVHIYLLLGKLIKPIKFNKSIILLPISFHTNEINWNFNFIEDCFNYLVNNICNLTSLSCVIIAPSPITDNIYILVYPLILLMGIFFMLPWKDLLNKRESIPDWKVEQQKQKEKDEEKDKELIRRLKRQAAYDWAETNYKQRDVYDPSFPDDAVLNQELKIRLHTRPQTLALYYLRQSRKDLEIKIYPNVLNRTGQKKLPARPMDYLTATGEPW